MLAAVSLALLLFGAALPASLASGSASLFQQGATLTGGEEELGAGRFGRSVALSADGDTALVGAPHDGDEAGAAWVFTRSGSTWTQQAKLTDGEAVGAGRFGRSVALSADGDTALIGAPNGGGAAWVFTRAGATWTEQAKLTGAGQSGNAWFGQSVALSADGETALVGGFVDHSDTGAAWVFARAGSTWTQQGEKLTGGGESGEGEFGWSVALSAEGDTALIGARKDGGGVGAAWVFTRSGSGSGASWVQQGEKLTGGGERGEGEFGQSVALSGDGDTALIGGFHDGENVGAAWVFSRSGSSSDAAWAQQGAKLTGAGEVGGGYFGDAVALTPDGSAALVGGVRDDEQRGAAWLFTRAGAGAGATWAPEGEKLTGGTEEHGKGEFGWGVALSAAGDTALVGGIGDSDRAGAAWLFGSEPPPSKPPPSGNPPLGSQPSGEIVLAQTQAARGGTSTDSTAKQGVAAYRAAGGGVVLLDRRIPTRGGRARVRLRCTAASTCRGRLTLRTAAVARAAGRFRAVTLGQVNFSISRGRAATVVLALNRTGRARLRAHRGRLGASLTIRLLAPQPPRVHVYAVRLVPRHAGR
jgi:hypothetical protein